MSMLQKSPIENIQFSNSTQAQERYGANTIGAYREVSGAFHPTSSFEVEKIIAWANTQKAHLYPISTGRNWGYGSSLPITDRAYIVDLSQLNRIINIDTQLGHVTVEPGVTQAQLYDYFKKNNLNYMVPTTGAGPTCSLLANALEKGYGITPYEDHFGALTSIKAILPDGRIYHSALNDFGGHLIDPIFKWKLGPYLEGLFAQGGFGIVTQGTIALAPRSPDLTQFFIFIDAENFESAVLGIAEIKQKLGAVLGGVNLMNKRRLISMVENRESWSANEPMRETLLRKLAKNRQIPDWAIMGGLYGTHEVVQAARTQVHSTFNDISKNLLFLNRPKLEVAEKLMRFLKVESLVKTISGIKSGLDILDGVPSNVALPIAYLKNKKLAFNSHSFHPDRDKCGLIWFSPLLPIEPYVTRDFAQEVTRICLSLGVEPLITMTAISEHCFDSTIPIVFDADSEHEKLKARKCYDALITLSKEFGVYPYRLDVESMSKHYANIDSVAVELAGQLQAQVDPNDILSRGRYRK